MHAKLAQLLRRGEGEQASNHPRLLRFTYSIWGKAFSLFYHQSKY